MRKVIRTMSKRIEWTVLGRKIGTATDWDEVDQDVIMLYDFEPALGIQLPVGDINFDFGKGLAICYGENGQDLAAVDLVSVLRDVDRA